MNNLTGNDPNNYYAYQVAAKRVKAKNGFKWNLTSYIVVNVFVIALYLWGCWDGKNWNWSYPWFIWLLVWPLGGWGIGVIFHFLAVYGGFPDKQIIRQEQINKELQRMGVSPTTFVPTSNYTPSEQPAATNPTEPASRDSNL